MAVRTVYPSIQCLAGLRFVRRCPLLLTLTGAVAPLTGFDGTASNPWLFGCTFLTPFLALLLMTLPGQIVNHPLRFLSVCLNPIYMVSGPIPSNIRLAQIRSWAVFKRRFHVYHRYAIVGAFFLFVAAPAFKSYWPSRPLATPGYSVIRFILRVLCLF